MISFIFGFQIYGSVNFLHNLHLPDPNERTETHTYFWLGTISVLFLALLY